MLDGFSGNAICKIANVSTGGTQFRDSMGSICYLNFNNLGTTTAPNYYMQIWNTTQAVWWRSPSGYSHLRQHLTVLQTFHRQSQTTVMVLETWLTAKCNSTMSGTANGAIYDGRYGYSMNVSVASIYGPRNSVLNQTGTIQEFT